MAYVPPHLRRKASRTHFLSQLVRSSDESLGPKPCSPADCQLWTELIRSSAESSKQTRPWYQHLEGYVYLKRKDGQVCQIPIGQQTTVLHSPRQPALCSQKLIDILASHTDSFYQSFPHEEFYDPLPDYESDCPEESDDPDECETSEDELV